MLGCGEFVGGGFDGGVDAGEFAGVRGGFGVELVETRASFLIAIGVGVVGDDAAFFGQPDAAFDEGCSFGFEVLRLFAQWLALVVVSFRLLDRTPVITTTTDRPTRIDVGNAGIDGLAAFQKMRRRLGRAVVGIPLRRFGCDRRAVCGRQARL